MSTRAALLSTIVKLAVAVVVSALLFVLVISAMRSPVSGETLWIPAACSVGAGECRPRTTAAT